MDEVNVRLQVACPGVDAEGVAELTRSLRDAILSLDVDSASPATAAPAAAGAKAGEAMTVGALVIVLAPIVVESLMAVVASWLSRQPGDVEIEIDGQAFKGQVTKAQRDELVDAYLRRLDSGS